jgi:hypothetical protein
MGADGHPKNVIGKLNAAVVDALANPAEHHLPHADEMIG